MPFRYEAKTSWLSRLFNGIKEWLVRPKIIAIETEWEASGNTVNVSIPVSTYEVPNSLLLVCLTFTASGSGIPPTTLSFNGKTLTRLVYINPTVYRGVAIYGVVNPGTLAGNITGTGGTSGTYAWKTRAFLISGVNQATPTVATATASSTSPLSTNITANLYGLIFDCVINYSGQTLTPGSGQTSFVVVSTIIGSYKIPTLTSETMAWSFPSDTTNQAIVSLNPV